MLIQRGEESYLKERGGASIIILSISSLNKTFLFEWNPNCNIKPIKRKISVELTRARKLENRLVTVRRLLS